MIITCTGSADDVCARLERNQREWRESRLPDELKRLGVLSYTLDRRGPQRYTLSIGLPGRHFFSCGTDVSVISDGDGTVIRYDPVLTPSIPQAALITSGICVAMVLLTALGGSWPSIGQLVIAIVAGTALTLLSAVFASAELPPYAQAIRAILDQAAQPVERGPES